MRSLINTLFPLAENSIPALNITTTFIHNEPTSLAILQEKGLPATMYESLEADSDPSVDVVSAVPNALGALCLNEAGINAFKERAPAILSRMLGSLTSEKHLRVLGDRENATMFGVTIEELMRHHPTLKPLVLNAIAEQSKRVRELAGDAVADAEALKAKTMRSVAKEGPATPVLESNEAKHPSLRYIEVLAKVRSRLQPRLRVLSDRAQFLEGICQSQTHGKELVKTSVVDDLLAAVTAPSLAPFFPEAGDAIKAVIGFFKAVSETSNVVVLASIIKVLRSSLAELQPYSIRSLHDDVFDDLIGAESALPA